MRGAFDFDFVSFQCVVIAAVASDIVARLCVDAGPAIAMTVFAMPRMHSLWLFFIFGLLLGGVGALFNAGLLAALARVDKTAARWPWLFALAVGGAFGLLAWAYPNLAGGGYPVLREALTGHMGIGLLLFLFLCRFAGTLLSYATGAPGGIFAPMLALGTLLGMAFGEGVRLWLPQIAPFPGSFAVAGMGALFASTVRAPLTGLVLIMEMTRNYELILPLLVTAIAAVVTAETLGGRPIYALLLERARARERAAAGLPPPAGEPAPACGAGPTGPTGPAAG